MGRLRGGGAGGLKFRRQHPIGPFILDFSCAEARLAVEADGAVRSEWLGAHGVRVLRFTNTEVVLDVDDVVSKIVAAATDDPHPNPLPLGEGADAAGIDHLGAEAVAPDKAPPPE